MIPVTLAWQPCGYIQTLVMFKSPAWKHFGYWRFLVINLLQTLNSLEIKQNSKTKKKPRKVVDIAPLETSKDNNIAARWDKQEITHLNSNVGFKYDMKSIS